VCPWNQRFASELAEPTFAARDALREHAAWALARLGPR
jgi:epoxyqueuosine reductase QueG